MMMEDKDGKGIGRKVTMAKQGRIVKVLEDEDGRKMKKKVEKKMNVLRDGDSRELERK